MGVAAFPNFAAMPIPFSANLFPAKVLPMLSSSAASSAKTPPANAPSQTVASDPTSPAVGEAPLNLLLAALLLGVLLGVLLTGGAVYLLRRPEPPAIVLQPPPPPAPTATPLPTATPAPLTVFVSGAVAQPGLYTLPASARVGDALAAAGGLSPEADAALVNQAERLWDGAQVHVPSRVEEAAAPEPPAGVSGQPGSAPSGEKNSGSGSRVNINTASLEELISLPGIGSSKAAAIIANRPYDTPQDLERVPGIGAKTVERLLDLITVR